MDDTQIEKIWRQGPAITPPPHLLAKLQSEIRLPRAATVESNVAWSGRWRAWAPALSFGLLVLASLVALGIQGRELAAVRRENAELRDQIRAADAMRANEASTAQQTLAAELELLRQKYDEIQKLRPEVERLRQELERLSELRAQNQALRSQLAGAEAGQAEDPFLEAKAAAESTRCINNLKQIGLGVRMWANDHGEVFPPDLSTAKNELHSPKILVCPSDRANMPANPFWENFTPAKASYEYLAPGSNERVPNIVLARCRIHGHVGMVDGSAIKNTGTNLNFVTEGGFLKLQPVR